MTQPQRLYTSGKWCPEGFVAFMCPGCGHPHSVRIRQDGGPRPSWEYNGNPQSPTLKPSVLVRTFARDGKTERRRCHSFVTDGRIRFLPDCTHSFAGQTIDLEEIEQ